MTYDEHWQPVTIGRPKAGLLQFKYISPSLDLFCL